MRQPSEIPQPLIFSPLTRREQVVLRLVAQGFSNKEIAATLCLSEQTIKSHLKSLFSKLSARNRVMAVQIAQKDGLI